MDDIMAKIQSVLSDKESMEQLSQLAQMFSQQPSEAQPESAPQNSVPDLSALFSAFDKNSAPGQSGQQSAGTGGSQGFDIGTVMALQSVMSKASAPDKNRDFLIALKPLLKEENQRKIDRMVGVLRILAILPALKESGILGGDLLGIL